MTLAWAEGNGSIKARAGNYQVCCNAVAGSPKQFFGEWRTSLFSQETCGLARESIDAAKADCEAHAERLEKIAAVQDSPNGGAV